MRKIIDDTEKLVKALKKSSNSITDKNVRKLAENWISNYHSELISALGHLPRAIKGLRYLANSLGNDRLYKSNWLGNLAVIKKGLHKISLNENKTVVFDPKKPFTAYLVLKEMFSEAKNEILVFDGYVEEGTLDILCTAPLLASDF